MAKMRQRHSAGELTAHPSLHSWIRGREARENERTREVGKGAERRGGKEERRGKGGEMRTAGRKREGKGRGGSSPS